MHEACKSLPSLPLLAFEDIYALPSSKTAAGALAVAHGATLRTTSGGGALLRRSNGSLSLLCAPAGEKALTCVSLSKDARLAAGGAGAPGGGICWWAIDDASSSSSERVQPLGYAPAACGGGGITALAMSADARWLAAVGGPGDQSLQLWHLGCVRGGGSDGLMSGGIQPPIACGRLSQSVAALSWSPDGHSLVTAGARHLKWWCLPLAALEAAAVERAPAPSKVLASVPGSMSQSGTAFTNFVDVVWTGPGAGRVAALSSEGIICSFGGATRSLERWSSGGDSSSDVNGTDNCCDGGSKVLRGALASTNERLYVGCSDGSVIVLDPASLAFLGVLPRAHATSSVGVGAIKALRACTGRSEAHVECIAALDSGGVMTEWHARPDEAANKAIFLHTRPVQSCALLAMVPLPPVSGVTRAVTLAIDGVMRLWSLGDTGVCSGGSSIDGVLIQTWQLSPPHESFSSSLACLAVSADGAHAAIGDAGGRIRVINIAAPRRNTLEATILELDMPAYCTGGVACLAFSPPRSRCGTNAADSSGGASENASLLLAAAAGDGHLHFFTGGGAGGFTPLSPGTALSAPATALLFSNCARRLIIATADGALSFWRPPVPAPASAHAASGTFTSGACMRLKVVRAPGVAPPLRALVADPTGRAVVAVEDGAQRLMFWSLRTGSASYAGRGRDGCGGGVRGGLVATGDTPPIDRLALSPSQTETGLAVDVSGLFVATLATDGKLALLDAFSGECMAVVDATAACGGDSSGFSGVVAFLADGCSLAVATRGGGLAVWRLAAPLAAAASVRLRELGCCDAARRACESAACSLRFVASGGSLASAGDEKSCQRAQSQMLAASGSCTSCSRGRSSCGCRGTAIASRGELIFLSPMTAAVIAALDKQPREQHVPLKSEITAASVAITEESSVVAPVQELMVDLLAAAGPCNSQKSEVVTETEAVPTTVAAEPPVVVSTYAAERIEEAEPKAAGSAKADLVSDAPVADAGNAGADFRQSMLPTWARRHRSIGLVEPNNESGCVDNGSGAGGIAVENTCGDGSGGGVVISICESSSGTRCDTSSTAALPSQCEPLAEIVISSSPAPTAPAAASSAATEATPVATPHQPSITTAKTTRTGQPSSPESPKRANRGPKRAAPSTQQPAASGAILARGRDIGTTDPATGNGGTGARTIKKRRRGLGGRRTLKATLQLLPPSPPPSSAILASPMPPTTHLSHPSEPQSPKIQKNKPTKRAQAVQALGLQQALPSTPSALSPSAARSLRAATLQSAQLAIAAEAEAIAAHLQPRMPARAPAPAFDENSEAVACAVALAQAGARAEELLRRDPALSSIGRKSLVVAARALVAKLEIALATDVHVLAPAAS